MSGRVNGPSPWSGRRPESASAAPRPAGPGGLHGTGVVDLRYGTRRPGRQVTGPEHLQLVTGQSLIGQPGRLGGRPPGSRTRPTAHPRYPGGVAGGPTAAGSDGRSRVRWPRFLVAPLQQHPPAGVPFGGCQARSFRPLPPAARLLGILGGPATRLGGPVTLVGGPITVALVGFAVALVGDPVAHMRGPLAGVGDMVTVISGQIPFIREVVSLVSGPLTCGQVVLRSAPCPIASLARPCPLSSGSFPAR